MEEKDESLDKLKKMVQPIEQPEETVTLTEMFEFIRWKDENRFEYNPYKHYWYRPHMDLPESLFMYSDSDLWKKYQEDKKPKI